MNTSHKVITVSAMLALAALLAGCTTPEETADDGLGNDTGGLGNDTGDGGAGFGDRRTVSIDGRVYECDDTLDADGICDEWQLDETATDTGTGASYQSDADGSVTIEGNRYTCHDANTVDVGGDSTGACETYVLDDGTLS